MTIDFLKENGFTAYKSIEGGDSRECNPSEFEIAYNSGSPVYHWRKLEKNKTIIIQIHDTNRPT